MKQALSTNIEQSRRLLACGVDGIGADIAIRTIKELLGDHMAWVPKLLTLPYDEALCIYDDDEISPAWSLSALLDLIPQTLMPDNRQQYTFRLIKCKESYIVEFSGVSTSLYQTSGTTAVEACVRMIEWLIANGYSLNKIKE